MLRCYSSYFFLCVLALATGCSTGRRVEGPLHAPAPVQKSTPLHPSDAAPKLTVGEYSMMVDSEPSGGIVVVNGVPVGRTPQRVTFAGTARGFFRDAVSVKVRFVAADTGHTSQTVEEVLTQLDKIPTGLHFTLSGVSRVSR